MPLDIKLFWISPELVLTGAVLVALLVAAAESARVRLAARRGKAAAETLLGGLRPSEWVSVLGVGAAGILALFVGVWLKGDNGATHFWGLMTHDAFSAYFKVAVALATLLVMAMSAGYRRDVAHRPEMFALLGFATLAIFFMASASELVMIFLAIEFLSIVSYVLAGYLKDEPRSAEAGLKYFLFGCVCSAVMLYGMSLLYGMTGTTILRDIGVALGTVASVQQQQIALIAAVLVMAGLGFKVSMVPFQQWVPDVYEGAPTPITAFLSVASKAAGFALIVRIFITAFGAPLLASHWSGVVGVLALITMTWGNTAAIWQTNIKRMLAYSGIAQAGYILVGLVAAGVSNGASVRYAVPGILLYIIAYIFMNLGAFAVVIAVSNKTGSDEIADYAGMGQRAPLLAAAMTFFLLSLIGIPPTAGFLAKLYLFLAAIQFSTPLLLALAIGMIVNSVISAFYYLNVVRQMYFGEAKDPAPVPAGRGLAGAVAIAAAATLAIFLFAQPFISTAKETATASTFLRSAVTTMRAER